MGITIYRQASERAFHNRIKEDPTWVACVMEYKQKLDTGFFDAWYRDMIFQKYMSVDITDAFNFAQVHTMLSEEDFVITEIPVGHEPSQDKFVAENNRKLSSLPAGYNAFFVGGSGDNDGYVKVVQPLIPNGEDARRHPLEVGYTKPERTFHHLKVEGRLARWPYGSKTLYLIYNW